LEFYSIEAFRVVGFSRFQKDFEILHKTYVEVKEVLENKVDSKETITETVVTTSVRQRFKTDLTQVSFQQNIDTYASKIASNLLPTGKEATAFDRIRKVLAVTDPKVVTEAISSLLGGFVIVFATLQSQIVQAMTLGSSLGDTLLAPFKENLLKIAEQKLPADLFKWADPALFYITRSIGIAIAIMLKRTILMANICSKAGELIMNGLPKMEARLFKTEMFKLEPQTVSAAVSIISLFGVAKQIVIGYDLPWLLWLFAVPLLISEIFFTLVSVMKIF